MMNDEGDTKITWDPMNPQSVEAATAAFKAAKSQGYQAFAMTSGATGNQMDGFDPNVGSILLIPALQGG